MEISFELTHLQYPVDVKYTTPMFAAVVLLISSSLLIPFAGGESPGTNCVSNGIVSAARDKTQHRITQKYYKMRPEEEDGGLGLYGSVDGGAPGELGYIKYYTWPQGNGADTINVEFVYVNEDLRGHGLSTELYQEMMRRLKAAGKNPTQITSEALAGVNKEAALRALIERLRSKPGFIVPSAEASVQEQFMVCCKNILKKFPDEQLKALAETPAHRAHADIGFKVICKGGFEIVADEPTVSMVSCLK